MSIELKDIMLAVSYRGTWKGFASIQRNLEENICKVTFNSRNELRRYIENIQNNDLKVKFMVDCV